MNRDEALSLLRRGKHGIKEWNQLRREGKQIPSLRGVALAGASLAGADLHEADLSGANLSQANVREANLSRATLNKANLSEADLSNANLAETDLGGVDLEEACFCGADLRRARFGQRNLAGLDFSAANLEEANLRMANLSGSKLSTANLRAADLTQADLTDADLSKANLTQAYLAGARLTEANLCGACLVNADLASARLQGVQIERADFYEANLNDADLIEVRGASRAKHLDAVRVESPARYFETCERTWRDRWLSWEIIRMAGNLRVFAVSYPLLVFLMAAFYMGGLYNEKIAIANAWADSVVASAGDATASKAPDPAAVLLAHEVKKAKPFLFPWTTVVLFASTIVLVVASSIYVISCPAEVKEYSRLRWTHELNRSLVQYWALAWKHSILRSICGALYGVGGVAFTVIVLCKLFRALYYVWLYGNIFPLGQ